MYLTTKPGHTLWRAQDVQLCQLRIREKCKHARTMEVGVTICSHTEGWPLLRGLTTSPNPHLHGVNWHSDVCAGFMRRPSLVICLTLETTPCRSVCAHGFNWYSTSRVCCVMRPTCVAFRFR
jgi:hypothetical protein